MSKQSALAVTHLDNRGSAEIPFGYLYFNDDTRAGYGSFDGEWRVFGGGEAWPTPTQTHLDTALAYLTEHGVAAARAQAA